MRQEVRRHPRVVVEEQHCLRTGLERRPYARVVAARVAAVLGERHHADVRKAPSDGLDRAVGRPVVDDHDGGAVERRLLEALEALEGPLAAVPVEDDDGDVAQKERAAQMAANERADAGAKRVPVGQRQRGRLY